MDWDWVSDWQAWLALAIALGVAEMFSLDLVLLMLAAGAAVGMVAGLLDLPLAIQVLAAASASVAMLVFVRPSVVKRLHGGPELRLGHSALIGRQAVVLEEVSVHGGRIRVDGDVWTARPFDETEVIEPGATVDIFEIRGATAVVHRIPALGT